MADRTIEVRGMATERVTADVATVSVCITSGGQTGREVSNVLKERTDAVVEALTSNGVSRDMIHTERYRLGDTDPFTEMDDPLHGSRTLTFDCRPDSLHRFATAIIQAGGVVDSVDLQVADERIAAVRESLLEAAVSQARSKAESIAEAHQASLGPVEKITQTEPDGFSSLIDEELGAGGDADLSGGPIEVSAAVTVVYELDPAP